MDRHYAHGSVGTRGDAADVGVMVTLSMPRGTVYGDELRVVQSLLQRC